MFLETKLTNPIQILSTCISLFVLAVGFLLIGYFSLIDSSYDRLSGSDSLGRGVCLAGSVSSFGVGLVFLIAALLYSRFCSKDRIAHPNEFAKRYSTVVIPSYRMIVQSDHPDAFRFVAGTVIEADCRVFLTTERCGHEYYRVQTVGSNCTFRKPFLENKQMKLARNQARFLLVKSPTKCLNVLKVPFREVNPLSDSEAAVAGGLAGGDPMAFFTALQIISREKGFSRKSDIRSFSALNATALRS
jgi:hypothetical protein